MWIKEANYDQTSEAQYKLTPDLQGEVQFGTVFLPYWCHKEKRQVQGSRHYELLIFGGTSKGMIVPTPISSQVYRVMVDLTMDPESDQVTNFSLRLERLIKSNSQSGAEPADLLVGDRFYHCHVFYLQKPINNERISLGGQARGAFFDKWRYLGVVGREAFHVFDLHRMEFVACDTT